MATAGPEVTTQQKTPTLSLHQFIRLKQKSIRASNAVCQKSYEDRLQKELLHLASFVDDKQAHTKDHISWQEALRKVSSSIKVANAFASPIKVDEHTLAENLLTGATTVDQVQKAVPGNERTSDVLKTIQNVVEDYQDLFEEAFLLLNAPKGAQRQSSKGLSYEHEKDARDIHLWEFYNVVVRGSETDKYPSMPCIADTYEDIFCAVDCFFRCQACKAKRATIVYNGHGKSSGHLHLEKEERPPTNSKFLEDVYAKWEQHKQKHENDKAVLILPSRITVVFAQCFGFIYQQAPKQKQVIEVVSLSSPTNPTTKFHYDFKNTSADRTPYIESSVHVELDLYARQRSESHTSDEQNVMADLNIEPGCGSSGSSRRDSGSSTVSVNEVVIPSLLVQCALDLDPVSDITEPSEDERFLGRCDRLSNSWKKKQMRPDRGRSRSACGEVLALASMSLLPRMAPPEKPSPGKHKKGKHSKKPKPKKTLSALAKSTLGALANDPNSSDSN